VLNELATAAVLSLGFTTHAAAEVDHHVQSARIVETTAATMDGAARGHHASETHDVPVIYLHGAHGLAEKGCPWMRPGANEVGVLVCPEAIRPDVGGTWSWGGDVREQAVVVNGALSTARARGASSDSAVAVGFSQGSYVALDLVKTHRASFRGLVLLGAEMHPSAERLCDGGVKRVVLGAGQLDGAHASMKEEAEVLGRASCLEVRFLDLGRVGHTYAAENTDGLRDAIVWAAGV